MNDFKIVSIDTNNAFAMGERIAFQAHMYIEWDEDVNVSEFVSLTKNISELAEGEELMFCIASDAICYNFSAIFAMRNIARLAKQRGDVVCGIVTRYAEDKFTADVIVPN